MGTGVVCAVSMPAISENKPTSFSVASSDMVPMHLKYVPVYQYFMMAQAHLVGEGGLIISIVPLNSFQPIVSRFEHTLTQHPGVHLHPYPHRHLHLLSPSISIPTSCSHPIPTSGSHLHLHPHSRLYNSELPRCCLTPSPLSMLNTMALAMWHYMVPVPIAVL